jgi:hypothetical protein
MQDLFYVAITIILFAIGAALTRGCEILENEEK